MNLIIPKVIQKKIIVADSTWLFYIYEDQADLYNESKFIDEVINICELYHDENIILSHQYFGFPFLLKIKGKENKVYFAHLRLNKELFLSELLDKSNPGHIEFSNHLNEFLNFDFNKNVSILEKRTKDYQLIDFFKSDKKFEIVDKYSEKLVLEIDKVMDGISKNLFEKSSDSFLSLISEYESLRNYSLKFIASLPSLDFKGNQKEVKRLFLEALRRIRQNNEYKSYPLYLRILIRFIQFDAIMIPAFLLSFGIHFVVELMAKRFIAGVDIDDAKNSLIDLKKSGRDSSLDPLGELVVSKEEADVYSNKVIEFINGFDQIYDSGERNSAEILKAHVSIKVSALTHHFCSEDIDYTYGLIAPRLKSIFEEAKDNKVFINIDAEHFDIRDAVVEIVFKVLDEYNNTLNGVEIGFVLQAYLRDSFEHLKLIEKLNENLSMNLPIRLVKGAYWDQETIEADAHHYNAPQFLNKIETDLHYKQMVYYLLDHDNFQLVLASHNLYDHAWAIALKERLFPQAKEIEHQCLHMTYEALSKALNQMGHCVRNYIPIGNLLVGMAYLVRRIMENSSQVGVLSQMRSDIDVRKILNQTDRFKELKQSDEWGWDKNISSFTSGFLNIPPIRTYLKTYRNDFDLIYKHYLDQSLEVTFDSKETALSKFNNLELSEWNDKENQNKRIKVLLKAAEMMAKRRYQLASIIILEANKGINEALADIDEAIDFIQFYIREEQRREACEARSALVIAPWNFPLAILCGMSVASLVRGHLTIMKPAEQTPYIGEVLYHLLIEAGVPKSSYVLVQGDGREVASPLIESKEIDIIVFTGSKEVGTLLYKQLTLQSKSYMKKVIAEMGGKNSIIVSKSSDLDEVLKGSLYSCYAHAGQKCSACSVIFIENEVYSKFIERFQKASEDINLGVASSFSTQINPLVSESEKMRVKKLKIKLYEKVKKWNGKILVDKIDQEIESLVGPFVFEISAAAYRSEELFKEEYFAPIIVLVKVEDLDEAILINNQSEYGLTCGIFSQSDDDIDYLLNNLENGNIYVNRSCTGARVSIEPFGGFKFSGTGPKAGGGNYLDAFDLTTTSLSIYTTTKIPGQNNYIDAKLMFSHKAIVLKDIKNRVDYSDHDITKFYSLDDFKDKNFKVDEKIEVIYIESMDTFNQIKSDDLLIYEKGLRKIFLLDEVNNLLGKERLIAINTMRYGAPIAQD